MKAISSGELDRMNHVDDRDFVLINVLPRGAFNERHIRTSINIPVDDSRFTQKVEAVAGSKDRDVVVYCGSFECNASPKAAQKLERAGFTHVYDFEGGTRDWFQYKQPQLDEA
jgi:rhodanese-related sulfurtransferase